MRRHVNAARLTLAQVVRLAASRPLPVARLGLEWFRTRPRDQAEAGLMLTLTEAECEPLRRDRRLVRSCSRQRAVRHELGARVSGRPACGCARRRDRMVPLRTRARDDVELWRKAGRISSRRCSAFSGFGTRSSCRRARWLAFRSLDLGRSLAAIVGVGAVEHPSGQPGEAEGGPANRACDRAAAGELKRCCRFWPWLCGRLARPGTRGRAWRRWRSWSNRARKRLSACRISGVEVAVTLCDDLNEVDPASGRAVTRDLNAAAFRRGRHWPSLCFPEAVVLSLPSTSLRH